MGSNLCSEIKFSSQDPQLCLIFFYFINFQMEFWVIFSESFHWLPIIQARCQAKTPTTYAMWLDNRLGRSQTTGHVKRGTSSDTDYISGSSQSGTLPHQCSLSSAFWSCLFFQWAASYCLHQHFEVCLSFSLLYREMEFPVVLSM